MTPEEAAAKAAEAQKGPNDDWQKNVALDESGNPIEGKPPVDEPKPIDKIEPIVKDDPAPDLNKDTDDKAAPVKFNTDAVKQVESFLSDAGLNLQDVARSVTAENGAVPIDVMKALVEKHGDAVASLIGDKLAAIHMNNVASSKAADTAIYNQVAEAFKGQTDQSGQDTWNELSTWAKKNVDAKERTEINKMLAAGGFQAKQAIDYLVGQFNNSTDFVETTAQLESADKTPEEYGGKPLDKHAYNIEVRKLIDKGYSETSPEFVALNARRDKSRSRGY